MVLRRRHLGKRPNRTLTSDGVQTASQQIYTIHIFLPTQLSHGGPYFTFFIQSHYEVFKGLPKSCFMPYLFFSNGHKLTTKLPQRKRPISGNKPTIGRWTENYEVNFSFHQSLLLHLKFRHSFSLHRSQQLSGEMIIFCSSASSPARDPVSELLLWIY